jgi:ferredoxin, 2Fe-2S
MPYVTFIHADGRETTIEVAEGTNVMQAATMNGIAGIVGECGGAAMCATCHVYVEPEQLEHLSHVSAFENEMLECTASPREFNSRLGCQIPLGSDLPLHLRVHVPNRQ